MRPVAARTAGESFLALVLEVGIHQVCQPVLPPSVVLHHQLTGAAALRINLSDVLLQLVQKPTEELVGVLHLVPGKLTVELLHVPLHPHGVDVGPGHVGPGLGLADGREGNHQPRALGGHLQLLEG